LHDSGDFNIPWPSIREHIKISAEDNLGQNGRKQHKPKCDEVSQIFTSEEAG